MKKQKYPLINKTPFQAMCIVLSMPLNFLLFIFSLFLTLGLIISEDWNFIYSFLGVIIFGMNCKSIFSLMDYPDE